MLAPPEDSRSLWPYLQQQSRTLKPELLVKLLRREHRRGERELCDRITRLLLELDSDGIPLRSSRCEAIIRRTAYGMGFAWPRDVLNEFRSRCYSAFVKSVLSDDEFWEKCFPHAFECDCVDAGRKLKNENKHYVPLEDDEDIPNKESDFAENAGELPPDVFAARWVDGALGRLPEKERLVIYLHELKGLPVESIDPSAHTVATVLGISGRMVRKYLHRARKQLAAMDPENPC